MAVYVKVGLLKEPVSALTHFAGFVAAIVGLVFIVVFSASDPAKVTGMAIYGGALAALFLASATYHFFDLGPRGNLWLQRVDHGAIFLLIAGTYTPTLIHLLGGTWRLAMLSAVAGVAVAGAVVKLAWMGCPRWLAVALYVGLGWMVVIPARVIVPQLDAWQLVTLVGGGLAYSVGAVVYLVDRPNPSRHFGAHEIWHLFVLAGAGAHFAFVWSFLERPIPPF